MLIGVIADDFTGASDIANTLAKGLPPEGGLRTAQFPGVPTEPVSSDIEQMSLVQIMLCSAQHFQRQGVRFIKAICLFLTNLSTNPGWRTTR